MSVASSYLYYPLIKIPDETLIYSLLYKDRVSRILPEVHGSPDAETFDQQAKIIKQALGYDFIESANFYEGLQAVSAPFLELVKSAHDSSSDTHSELFGKHYKQRFKIAQNPIQSGTQYFLYPHKLSPDAFDYLIKVGWMNYDKRSQRCEVANELFHVYMTALAASVSGEDCLPIYTNNGTCEGLLRSKIFQEQFGQMLPAHYQGLNDLAEFCVEFLLTSKVENANNVPLAKLLSLNQASYIRAGLEMERRAFCDVVDRAIRQVEALDPKDAEGFLRVEMEKVRDAAIEFGARVDEEVIRNATAAQKEQRSKWTARIGIAAPVLGGILAWKLNLAGIPAAAFTAGGINIGSRIQLAQSPVESKEVSANPNDVNKLTNVYLNRLWDVKQNKLTAMTIAPA